MIRKCHMGCIPRLMLYNPYPHACRTEAQYAKYLKQLKAKQVKVAQ